MPHRIPSYPLILVLVVAACICGAEHRLEASSAAPIDEASLRRALDLAAPFSEIRCNPDQSIEVSQTLVIQKPLTLIGLTARLRPKLGKTPLLSIKADRVTLLDLTLTGNGDSVPQDQRAPLIQVAAGEFRIERVRFDNASKDGINVDGDAAGRDIVSGVIRDITGRNVIRDTVSISGGSYQKFKARGILVENVRAYDGARRGAVEVSDGSENVTVRTVYAERCVYAVDVQDHGKDFQVNRHIVIEDVYAVDCRHALRTSNRALGHLGLTVRDVTAERCIEPIRIKNTGAVFAENLRVFGMTGPGPAILLQNCPGAIVRDLAAFDLPDGVDAVKFESCLGAKLDGASAPQTRTN